MAKKNKVVEGAAVRTSTAFQIKLGLGPYSGVVLRPDPTIGGAWYVRLDGVERPWVINEKWLEVT